MLGMARYGTRDLPRARDFYDAISEIIGGKRLIERDDVVAYMGPAGGMFLIGKPLVGEPSVGNGTQIVFLAPSHASVDAAYAKALELGGSCEGAPGPRGPAEMNMYAAYFRDPEGNKIMLNCTGGQ